MRSDVKTRFRLFRRCNGVFYCEDSQTGKQTSLGTREQGQARRLIHARNEAQLQLGVNLQIARAYLMASDPDSQTRSWQHVMNEIARTKTGSTHGRWLRAIRDKAFDLIRDLPILETRSQHFLRVLAAGTVATNVYLRRVHKGTSANCFSEPCWGLRNVFLCFVGHGLAFRC